jgi:hypothetical protein
MLLLSARPMISPTPYLEILGWQHIHCLPTNQPTGFVPWLRLKGLALGLVKKPRELAACVAALVGTAPQHDDITIIVVQ